MFVRPVAKSYTTADLMMPADLRLDIEQIGMPNQFDTIIASHVLEHVDDSKAMRSIYDTLRPNGTLLAMVPIAEGTGTFEDPSIVSRKDRELHYEQHDHVRYYGSDFVTRLQSAGFKVDRFYADNTLIPRLGLIRGECVFACQRLSP